MPVLVHNANCPTADESAHARASENAARSSRPGEPGGEVGATGGLLWIKGHGLFDLSSDLLYPGIRAPAAAKTETSFFGSHVEVQAAALMQKLQATEARLMITHHDGVCGFCRGNLEAMLPYGATLTVRFQRNRKFFTGGVFTGS